MDFFLQLLISGIMIGGIYSLVALGFVIIYKSTGVINFSHGQLLAMGALMMWIFWVMLDLPFWMAALFTIGFAALLGATVEHLFIRPMTGQPLMAAVIMTIGLSGMLDSILYTIFGAGERTYPHIFPSGGIPLGELNISYAFMCSFVIALLLVGFFLYFFHYTRIGIIMRAVADGHDTARSCSIKVGLIFKLVWIIATISAVIGGYLWGSVESVYPAMAGIAMSVFPVIILGGLDSITGCIVAGPIVGVAELMAAGYVDPITEGGSADVIPYIIIIATLIIRPHGLFGEKHIERI